MRTNSGRGLFLEGGERSMESEVLVDALPYIDQEYDDPNFREAVSLYM